MKLVSLFLFGCAVRFRSTVGFHRSLGNRRRQFSSIGRLGPLALASHFLHRLTHLVQEHLQPFPVRGQVPPLGNLRLLLLLSLRIFLKFPLQKGVLGLQELVVILGLVDRGQV